MKLVCVVGPTGCGKTWLGVELAKMLGGEVVSCDSMQIYRGMVIGTAAPTAEEMQGIPHHMVGVADPRENYSVARYADDAAKCVDDILSRGKQPVIVGGTGLYLNALLAGHGFAGGDKDGRYRAELESRWDKEGGEAMFAELRRIDPETAGNLHLNDKKRILRALEVYYETGKTMAQHNAETKLIPPRYDSVRIGLAYEDRDDMKRAIDLRVDKMVEAGLFDEVRALLDSGLPRDVTAMQAIGYKETLAYLDGEAAREEAIDEIIRVRADEFSRIQARFKIRLSLTSSSVDEVIQKRILRKTPEAEQTLSSVYDANDSVLRNIFTFTDSILDIKGFFRAAGICRGLSLCALPVHHHAKGVCADPQARQLRQAPFGRRTLHAVRLPRGGAENRKQG